MNAEIRTTLRGVERATKRSDEPNLRRTTVKSNSGTRSEMLPADPHVVARILTARRKKAPALKARDRMAAEAARRTDKRVGN